MATDIANTKIGQTGPIAKPGLRSNIFAFSSNEIEKLKAKIPQYKQPHDQMAQVRPLRVYDDLAARKDIETVTYKNPKPVEVPGQQAQVPEVSVEPGIKTAKGLINNLKTVYSLATDPKIKALAKAAILEQQKLDGVD